MQPNEAKLSPKFAYYMLISEGARQYFEATAKGVGYPAIDDKDFNTFEVPLPSLLEQQRIAAYLDASCAAIDAAVAAKRRQLEVLDILRSAEFHAAFDRLSNVPTERFKDVATKIGSGVTPEGGATGYLYEGIPLIRSQNVHFDGLRLDDVAYISEETYKEMSNSQLMPRDVLLNITGASIGRCTFVPANFGEGNVNQHVCIIRPNYRIHYEFLAAFLSSPMGQAQVLSSFTGASRQGLSHKDLGLIRIPLPGIDTQKSTCTELNARFTKIKRVTDIIEKQIAALTAYRKSLIHECVTGQRRVTEADLTQTFEVSKNLEGLQTRPNG
ncbi:MAG: restriction endonuclease subunit S [Chloroflexi bacterium]|nr:restriction endonuclease subunit S [Chloroflexota bacterium]